MKYFSSALILLLFCMPCIAMHSPDPSSLERLLNQPEHSQANDNTLAISLFPCVNDNTPQTNDIPLVLNMPAAQERPSRSKVTNEQGKTGYLCQYCLLMFPWASSRNHHEHVACPKAQAAGKAKEKNIRCPSCTFACFYQSELDRHLIIHTEDRPYQCYCSQTFKRDQHFFNHKKECSKYIATARLMNNHSAANMTNQDNDFAQALGQAQEKKIRCSHCDYRCDYPYELTRHMVAHTNERPYQCYCLKTFKRSSHFLRHRRNCSKYRATARLMNNQRTDNMTDQDDDDDSDVEFVE